jgi:hypothetical protein
MPEQKTLERARNDRRQATLSASRRQVLNRTKIELRKVFHREPGKHHSSAQGRE